jgi:hypothetical protein
LRLVTRNINWNDLCHVRQKGINEKDCEDLYKYGPSKPLEAHGFTEEQLEELTKNKENNANVPKPVITKNGIQVVVSPDPTGRRIGEGMKPQWCLT